MKNEKCINRGIVLILISAAPILIRSACAAAAPAVLLFDAGASCSETSEGRIPLTPADLYDRNSGWGWICAPKYAFVRPALSRSRDLLTIDGVAGSDIAFRADLAPGTWRLTLYVEAGLEDSSTMRLEINGMRRDTRWHAFRPPAEPRSQRQSSYRVYHGRIELERPGLVLRMAAGLDSIRLLGLSLIPQIPQRTAEQEELLRAFRNAGTLHASAPLDSLRRLLDQMGDEERQAPFAAYWREQLALLIEAERYISMRGWEWAAERTGLGLFDRYHQIVMLLDGILNREDAEQHPFYERALWMRARMLYWLGRERHGRHTIAGAERDLRDLLKRAPDDELLRMYAGERIRFVSSCDSSRRHKNAPAWSVAQRDVLCKMRKIVHWWVEQRQAANGEMGGKIGDDVEMLRWWIPLILAGDTVALRGWKRLADGAWRSPKVHDGFSRHAIDVEHASEFIADTAPQMALFSDDPLYLDRLRRSAAHFSGLWTGFTGRGNRLFRSAWYSSTIVDPRPPRNRDLEYNARSVKAVRYLAWRTGDAALADELHQWSKTWCEAAMSTEKGKPAGIVPASIRFPDEAINGDEPNWYEPGMFWDYFNWTHLTGSMILDQLLFTFTLTNDSTLLQPFVATLELIAGMAAAGSSRNYEPGSPAWAVSHLNRSRFFWNVISQWRLLVDDPRFDGLLMKRGSPYLKYRLSGDHSHLLDALRDIEEQISSNFPMLTREVMHTDRVYVRGYEQLKGMLTGGLVLENMSPYTAVSYEGTDDDFTALVERATPETLMVRFFSHSSMPCEIRARLWQLVPGRYGITLSDSIEKSSGSKTIEQRGFRLPLTLPPGRPLLLSLERIK